mmetsp:Transcript_39988/g.99060  ORF Transcript_39988/g.99060 Transcript_39988/m.99060 type:complete len:209 (-) Transcript_39988:258-884(-)
MREHRALHRLESFWHHARCRDVRGDGGVRGFQATPNEEVGEVQIIATSVRGDSIDVVQRIRRAGRRRVVRLLDEYARGRRQPAALRLLHLQRWRDPTDAARRSCSLRRSLQRRNHRCRRRVRQEGDAQPRRRRCTSVQLQQRPLRDRPVSPPVAGLLPHGGGAGWQWERLRRAVRFALRRPLVPTRAREGCLVRTDLSRRPDNSGCRL